MKASKKSVKAQKSRRNILVIVLSAIGLFVVLAVVLASYKYYEEYRADKILSDAISNSGDLLMSQGGKRFLVEFEPTNQNKSINISFDLDGQIIDGVYKGNIIISTSIFRFPINISGDVISADDKQYIRLSDLESSIEKTELGGTEFKLYSGYIRQIATKIENRWILLDSDDKKSCLLDVKAKDLSKITVEDIKTRLLSDSSVIRSVKKLGEEEVSGDKSYKLDLELEENQTDLNYLISKRCGDLKLNKDTTIEVWVSKKDRLLKKLSVQTNNGKYSIEILNSRFADTAKNLELPQDYTTVSEVQKEVEQIIGTVK